MEALIVAPVVTAADTTEPTDVRRNRLEDAFSSCCDGLYRFILVRVGGHRDVADDLLQQTCFIAAGKNRLPDSSDCEAWLFGIARNVVRKHWRSERARGHNVPLLDAEHGTTLVDAMESGPLPAEVLESDEAATRLLVAVTALPADDQRLVFAFYFQGRSHAEISNDLGMTPKGVETKLYRIRRRLRALLLEPEKEGGS